MAGGVQAGGSLAKNHYEVLDGLRGVAALLVVAFHTFEPNDYGVRFHQIINHGYLAVDFFFLLSGFVVAYAYDDRWPRMSQWSFYKRRLIRLQPMIVMGSLIGAALFYFQKGAAFPLVAATPVWKMLAVMIFGFTLLPLPTQLDIRGWNEMHPLDGPAWSLFFEYIANLLYALWLRRLSLRWLSVLTVLAAVFLTHMLVTGEGDAIDCYWRYAERNASRERIEACRRSRGHETRCDRSNRGRRRRRRRRARDRERRAPPPRRDRAQHRRCATRCVRSSPSCWRPRSSAGRS